MDTQAAGLVHIVGAVTLALGGLDWTGPMIGLLAAIAVTRHHRIS